MELSAFVERGVAAVGWKLDTGTGFTGRGLLLRIRVRTLKEKKEQSEMSLTE